MTDASLIPKPHNFMKENGLTLRQAEPSDAQTIHVLMQRIYPALYAYLWQDGGSWFLHEVFSKTALRKELADPRQPCWIVNRDGNDIGILKLSFNECPGKEEVTALKIHRLYLDAASHRKGIGSQLLAFCEVQARNEKSTLLWLESMQCEPKATRFYEKNGFSVTGVRWLEYPHVPDHFRPMHLMTKQVTET